MKHRKLFFLLMIVPMLFVYTGCSKDEDPVTPPPQINEAQVLAEYLEANGDFLNTAAPAVTSAKVLYADLLAKPDKIHVIDIRTQADYETKGHISGAIRVDLKNIVTYMKGLANVASYEKIVIACYSGQSAGVAVSVLRLLGYNTVSSLKFGMSSWNAACAASWVPNTGYGNNYTNFVTTDAPKAAAGTLPTINTGKTTGKEILEARITQFLATTSASPFDDIRVTWSTVTGNLSNYYIVNYWSAADYAKGHLPGAIQYTPRADLKLSAALKTLPTNKPIAIYCFTGQTSAQVSTILKLLGYDAKTLMFGVNIMNYDWMKANGIANSFNPTEDIFSYPFVLGPNPK
ncbi:MAG: rhodanese-related sulfurtransferase [Ignavibacteria bacterium]|nr:MAG: rhodanese-related sulfurtransferase [Ignavibacteria bacterium]KAF0161796.1 MAG: rhodanese-related sulfurtransferase [Ignavibacteria bacterium]